MKISEDSIDPNCDIQLQCHGTWNEDEELIYFFKVKEIERYNLLLEKRKYNGFFR